MHQLSGARFDWKQLTSPSHLVSVLTKEAVPCGCLTKTFVVSGSPLLLLCSPKCWTEACFFPRQPGSQPGMRHLKKGCGLLGGTPDLCTTMTPNGNTILLDPSPWSLWGFLFPSCPSLLISWPSLQIKTLVLPSTGAASLSSSGDWKLPEVTTCSKHRPQHRVTT